ncbi:MAG TPA: hypothetical protein VJ978_09160, partial [Nitriliruptoraceae bacterium]|nr:hypothetical protein [Nitriliruptoraceae bacterium]
MTSPGPDGQGTRPSPLVSSSQQEPDTQVADSYLAMLLHPQGRMPWIGAFLSRIVLGMLIVSVVLLVRRTGNGYGVA